MNTNDLAKKLASTTGASQAEMKATLTAVFDEIAETLARGDEVAITGFGKFAVRSRPERPGRNPRTGEQVTFAASRNVGFSASKGLKDKL
jgi:DNA-binding protein HU-beta